MTVTLVSPRLHSASDSAAGRPPRLRSAENGASAQTESVILFAPLLDAGREWIETQLRAQPGASPAQMFEPAVADAHERRQTTLKARDRLDAAASGHQLDPTGIEARRETKAEIAMKTASPPNNTAPGVGHTAVEAVTAPASQPRNEATTLHNGNRRSDSSPAYEARSVSILTAESPSPRGAHAGGPPTTPPPPIADGAVVTTAADAVVASDASNRTVAEHATQVLTAGKIGTGPPGQNVATVAVDGDPRRSAFHSKPPSSAPAARSGSDATHRTTQETDAAPRSAFEQLVRAIRLQTGPKHSSAQLQLHPPELGRVRVDVRMEGDQIQMDVRTETDAARELLTRRAAELRTALEQHGIFVDRFDVTTAVPPAPPLYAGADYGSAVLADARRDSPPTSFARSSRGAPADDDGGLAGWIDLTEAAVAGKTRLDIRV